MGKKKIKVLLNEQKILDKEIETEITLTKLREQLLADITFPYLFLNSEEEEIPKEKEPNMILEDILEGRVLYLKKEIVIRKMLGEKVETKDGLDYYVYPTKEFTEEELKRSSNIMVIGETGVGKSTWLHCFINYLQGIQMEEKYRYYLFNEKKLEEDYEKKTGHKKTKGCSVTNKPAIYNIESTVAFNNPIRLIDTAGFGDVREGYDKTIVKDIHNLFTNEIETIHSICLLIKCSETRAHDRTKYILDQLFSLFGKEIINNIVVIFTFYDGTDQFPALNTLQDEASPFSKIMGNIKDLQYFIFNNMAYFTSEKKKFGYFYENNGKNFGKLLTHIFSLPKISLQSTKKVIQERTDITDNIINICHELGDVIKAMIASVKNRDNIEKYTTEMEKYKENKNVLKQETRYRKEYRTETYKEYCDSGWYVLYCNTCNRVCHRNCKGSKEGFHSSTYGCDKIRTVRRNCVECGCHYEKHSFDGYIQTVRTFTIDVPYTVLIPDETKVADEKQKTRQREQISKLIEEQRIQLNELDKSIHDSLDKSLLKLSLIAAKEKELNKIALKKYEDQKFGYCKKILKETMSEPKIENIFNKTLDNIESIYPNEDEREQSIIDIKNMLLKADEIDDK